MWPFRRKRSKRSNEELIRAIQHSPQSHLRYNLSPKEIQKILDEATALTTPIEQLLQEKGYQPEPEPFQDQFSRLSQQIAQDSITLEQGISKLNQSLMSYFYQRQNRVRGVFSSLKKEVDVQEKFVLIYPSFVELKEKLILGMILPETIITSEGNFFFLNEIVILKHSNRIDAVNATSLNLDPSFFYLRPIFAYSDGYGSKLDHSNEFTAIQQIIIEYLKGEEKPKTILGYLISETERATNQFERYALDLQKKSAKDKEDQLARLSDLETLIQ